MLGLGISLVTVSTNVKNKPATTPTNTVTHNSQITTHNSEVVTNT